MTTPTLEKPIISLEDQISILNEAQLEAIFAYYGEQGLKKYDESKEVNATPQQVQSALAGFINNDNNSNQKTKLLKQLEEYDTTYRLREESLNEAEETAKMALQSKREAKKELDKSATDFIKTLERNLTDNNKALLQQRRIDQKNDLAWEKREKIRQRGIDAYLKGVVASVIDGMEDDYMKEASSKAHKIIEVAKAQVKALQDKDTDPKSMESTNLILKNSFPKKQINDKGRVTLDGRRAILFENRRAQMDLARETSPSTIELNKPKLPIKN